MINFITFNEIYPIWSEKVWPGRQSRIEKMSTLRFLGGHDMEILRIYQPTFIGFKGGVVQDRSTTSHSAREIISTTPGGPAQHEIHGVTSGHRTASGLYRARTLYVSPEQRRKGVGTTLLRTAENVAALEGCTGIWAIPRLNMVSFYEKHGYVSVGQPFNTEEFGPNVYMVKKIGS